MAYKVYKRSRRQNKCALIPQNHRPQCYKHEHHHHEDLRVPTAKHILIQMILLST